MKKLLAAASAAALAGMVAGAAHAQGPIGYPCCGYNNTTYTFTAANNGDVVAFFAGSTAGFDNQLGLLVNGVQQGGFGLDDHSTAVGTSFDFGPVHAGDHLVFILHVNSLGGANAFSDPAMNVGYDNGPASGTADGHNHIYSTVFTGSNPGGDTAALNAAGIPHGVYVAFEDLPFPGSDYNYHDENFVFTNVGVAVPEPATWALMLMGVAMLGFTLRSRKPAAALA
jgi:hypothetical protein